MFVAAKAAVLWHLKDHTLILHGLRSDVFSVGSNCKQLGEMDVECRSCSLWQFPEKLKCTSRNTVTLSTAVIDYDNNSLTKQSCIRFPVRLFPSMLGGGKFQLPFLITVLKQDYAICCCIWTQPILVWWSHMLWSDHVWCPGLLTNDGESNLGICQVQSV